MNLRLIKEKMNFLGSSSICCAGIIIRLKKYNGVINMTYKCEKETTQRTEKYIKTMEKKGVKAEISMVRDYMCKLRVFLDNKDCGNLIVYYKPKKDRYTLGVHELKDNSTVDRFKKYWDESLNQYPQKKIKVGNENSEKRKRENELVKKEVKIENIIMKTEDGSQDKSSLKRTEKIYNSLKKYRNCHFDFIELAEQLKKVIVELESLTIKKIVGELLQGKEIEDYRYQFDRLEALYLILEGRDNG